MQFPSAILLLLLLLSRPALSAAQEPVLPDLGALLSDYQKSRGRAAFGPAPASVFGPGGRWAKISDSCPGGGCWIAPLFSSSKALDTFKDRLYVGLRSPVAETCAQVWAYDGAAWRQVGGDGRSGSWTHLSALPVLRRGGDSLYAGLGVQGGDAEVWAYDGSAWKQIGAAGLPGAWPRGRFFSAYCLAWHKGALFAGMVAHPEVQRRVTPDIYRFDGARWERVAGDGIRKSWTTRDLYDDVYELWSSRDGFLYAGLSRTNGNGPACVWRFDGRGWEKIGGEGVRGSWINPLAAIPYSFADYQGRLILSLTRYPLSDQNFSPVWAFDGASWQPVGAGSIPDIWRRVHNYNALASYRGRLYLGAGEQNCNAYCSIWELADNGSWRQVAGGGKYGSWNRTLDFSGQNGWEGIIYRMVEFKGALAVGFGQSPGSSMVWLYRPGR